MDGEKPKERSEGNLKEISRALYEAGAIKFGEFILTSGKKSPYYVDLRTVPSLPKIFEKLADAAVDIVRGELEDEVEKIAGVPTAGLPLAVLVAHKSDLPLIYARKQRKPHGRKKAVEELLRKGDRVLIVDDVTTTGRSIADTAEKVRNEGGRVENALVMVEREEGAVEALEEENVSLHYCFEISDLIGSLRGNSLLSEERYNLVLDYLKGEG